MVPELPEVSREDSWVICSSSEAEGVVLPFFDTLVNVHNEVLDNMGEVYYKALREFKVLVN